MLKKKILFVVNVDWFFVSHRLPIALAAKANGYDVHVATTLSSHSHNLEKFGFVVHKINISRSGLGLMDGFCTLISFLSLLYKLRPTIVHLVTIKPVLFGSIAARLTKTHSVVVAISGLGHVFVSGSCVDMFFRFFISLAYRFGFKHKNIKVIFQNNHDKSVLSGITGIDESKTMLIPGSGVDLVNYPFQPMPSSDRIVLFAGRLLINKGIFEFVNAARCLQPIFIGAKPQIRFVIVGSLDFGNPKCISREHLMAWVDEGIIEYWGHRDDMPSVLSSASIVVLPSYYGEGLPKILIEAAACGRAVVTTDQPGCRDAIDPNVTGLLIPVRDAEALAKAIQNLLEHPKKCQDMGRAGRDLAVRVFDVKRVIAAHLEIYDEMLMKTPL